MMFSVAPTLGRDKLICRPCSGPHSQVISPPSSWMCTPSLLSASKCRSMGRGPNSQPPGYVMRALPQRARIGPRKMTEERISRIRSSGISHRSILAESTTMVPPLYSTRQPKCRKMAMAEWTSFRSGQLCMIFSPPLMMVAAKIGKILFLAPLARMEPLRGFPPFTISLLIILPPVRLTTRGMRHSRASGKHPVAGGILPHTMPVSAALFSP